MKHHSCLKEFAQYSWLSVLGMLGVSCYILADTFFISKGLGTNGLAALNLALPVYNFVHGTGLMLGMGGATKFSICKSQKDFKTMNLLFSNTMYASVFFSVIFVISGLFLSKPLAALLGADADILSLTDTYLKWLLIFAPAFILNAVLLCFVRNDGNPQLSMYAMLVGSMSNIVLDYLFIFPLQLGMLGAILATCLSPVISILVMSPHWLGRKKQFHFVKAGLHWNIIRLELSLGFPSLISQLSSGIVMIIFNALILNLQGNTGVAAYGVIANISLVVIAVYTGIAQGIQPLFSQYYGIKNIKNLTQILRYAMITMLMISCGLYLLLFLFAAPVSNIFNSEHNARLQEIAMEGLKLYFTSAAFTGFNIIIATFFASIEKTVPAHMISLLRGLFLIVPMAFLLSALWGMTGIWLTCPVTELLVALTGLELYHRYTSSAAL